ncbi:hypothetical protein [Kosakonia pseudosacchari]|uniref:hypothetical protein n=1 Tax=Kosakonia pseudosacchari TaxID=1646340 RepID=UPI002FDE70B3
MDESLLECDLDWFGVAPDGLLAHLATAGVGPVPVEFSGSVANYELVFDYFASLQPMSDIELIEENLEEMKKNEIYIEMLSLALPYIRNMQSQGAEIKPQDTSCFLRRNYCIISCRHC